MLDVPRPALAFELCHTTVASKFSLHFVGPWGGMTGQLRGSVGPSILCISVYGIS